MQSGSARGNWNGATVVAGAGETVDSIDVPRLEL